MSKPTLHELASILYSAPEWYVVDEMTIQQAEMPAVPVSMEELERADLAEPFTLCVAVRQRSRD